MAEQLRPGSAAEHATEEHGTSSRCERGSICPITGKPLREEEPRIVLQATCCASLIALQDCEPAVEIQQKAHLQPPYRLLMAAVGGARLGQSCPVFLQAPSRGRSCRLERFERGKFQEANSRRSAGEGSPKRPEKCSRRGQGPKTQA